MELPFASLVVEDAPPSYRLSGDVATVEHAKVWPQSVL